jgi:hypothetical protein
MEEDPMSENARYIVTPLDTRINVNFNHDLAADECNYNFATYTATEFTEVPTWTEILAAITEKRFGKDSVNYNAVILTTIETDADGKSFVQTRVEAAKRIVELAEWEAAKAAK